MTTDPWHFSRTELAAQVLGMFNTGLSSALTFFAPRRMGKTEFLRKDIMPAAEAAGWSVFYYSFLDADASAQAFAAAIADFVKGDGWLSRTFGRVGKVSGGAAGISAGVEIKDAAPDDIKAVVARLAERNKRSLLLLDEVQALATPGQASFVAALRTALDMHKDNVKVIFTGSSREGLRRMFSQANAPFFHFGQNLSFPSLDKRFTDHLADMFRKTTTRSLDADALWQAFREMGDSPQLARALVERMALQPGVSIEAGKEALVSDINSSRNFAHDWQKCSGLERLLLKAIASGVGELYGVAHRERLAQALGVPDVGVSSVQSALRSMMRRGLVYKSEGRSNHEIEDSMFKEWLLTEQF